MVKVLHLINGEHYSGAERVQDLLAQHLPDQGYCPTFVCLKPNKFPELRNCQNVPAYEMPMHFKMDLSPSIQLIKLVRKQKYALIHTHTPRAALIGNLVSRFTRVPLVHHFHSPTLACTGKPLRNQIVALQERISLSAASRLIAVSSSIMTYLQMEGFSTSRISLVRNGVPSTDFLPARSKPKGEWIIGTVALFRHRKGIETLLHALKQLQNKGIRFHLLAVGTFETTAYENRVKQLSKQLNIDKRIHWIGFVKNVASYFAKMDVFVLPSLYGEGLPMVILEAMAAGVPVVCTKVEGAAEVIENGKTGLLVEPSSSSDLAAAIQKIVTAEVCWSSMRANAYAIQRAHFSSLSMTKGVADIYKEILS